MSWVMNITAMPCCCCSRLIRSRISAWVVTSSAVVGSSAISSERIAGERHGDHRALAHAAGELEGVAVDRAFGVGDLDLLQQVDRARPRRLLAHLQCRRSTSTIWSPTVCTGDSEDIGSWKIIAISRAADGADRARRADRAAARSTDAAVRGGAAVIGAGRRCGPGGSTICRIERAVTLLPEPLSPTTQRVRAALRASKRHAVDRLHDAVAHREMRREVAHLERPRRCGCRPRRMPSGCAELSTVTCCRDRRRRAGRRRGS